MPRRTLVFLAGSERDRTAGQRVLGRLNALIDARARKQAGGSPAKVAMAEMSAKFRAGGGAVEV